MAKIYVKAFGISCGIVAAALSFLIGVMNILIYFGSGLSGTMTMIYFGCRPTLFSIIFNSMFCFVFAFCVGGLIALLYNGIVQESEAQINEKIKLVARSIWESKGKPGNSSAEDWKEAEKRVKGFN